ncbi:MAG: hypothetical protein JRG92_15150 [Deltaproteobacteria bacterium]|nr:hypothetical protein [Deltaproteobacteria bacterium]MBW2384967.1 hypothetical protein [Deltaproteobacteria bacterium]MBW2698417.1 hypothetical protein [Deltaproteobacteria bacterium]
MHQHIRLHRGLLITHVVTRQQDLALEPMHRGANEYLGELFLELGRIDRAKERLAVLDRACPFGCAEYEDLRRRIESRSVAAR